MAETEKEHVVVGDTAETTAPYDAERHTNGTGPSWMYRKWNAGPLSSWYASPATQLALVAFVCFLCPGMFNAVNGIGAGGQVDPTVANNGNIALYSTFSVVGFFAGSIVNRAGVKFTLSFGGIGYCVYIAAFLCYNHTKNSGFVIFSGALLGACAGCLWAAQGAIMMSYPGEANKGKYISWFWMIFNMGGVIGTLIPLGQNINNSTGVVTDGTYIGFIVLMALGAALAWSLVDAGKVVRPDGSRVILMKHPTWQSEIKGLFEVFKTDWYILLFFPMFFASNFFYTYQFNDVNLAKFNVRTRSLNGVLYWLSQILGAYVFGYGLDIKRFKRTTRAKGGLAALFIITMVVWGGGYAFQKGYDRDPDALSSDPEVLAKVEARKLDWTSDGYIGPMFLYMFYGFFDAAWQTTVYWFMGSLSNNSRKLANFAGFYKGIQSAGGAIAPTINNQRPSYMSEFGGNWGLLAGSLFFAAPVIFLKIRDHVPIEDDIKFSDETVEEVKGTGKAEEVH
jgi:MFS family permease